jgi:hypothetical protein
MSWSANTLIVDKKEINHAIDNPTISPMDIDGPMLDQLKAAQDVAKELVKSISGPKMRVSMNGHANGVGWNRKEGWSNDSITVSVYQEV